MEASSPAWGGGHSGWGAGGTTTCESLELTLTTQSSLLTAGERMGDTMGGGRESAQQRARKSLACSRNC